MVLEDLQKTCAECCVPMNAVHEHGIGEAMGTVLSELSPFSADVVDQNRVFCSS